MSKLREKFSEIIVKTHITPFEQGEQCEQISDDFAVKFAEWYISILLDSSGKYSNKTTTELLQIFKNNFYE